MPSWRNAWGATLLCVALALVAAPAALAQSAGNQQYVDPLASSTPSSSSSSGTTAAPASNSSPTPSSSSTGSTPASSSSASNSSPQTTSTTASGAPATSSSRTLPFTGLDLWAAVAIGFGLIGSGLAVRRVTRRT